MSMYLQFDTDKELEVNGVTVPYGDFRVTLARAGGANKRFVRALESKSKPYRRAIQTETMDDELGREIMRQVFIDTIILNWEIKVGDKWVRGLEDPKWNGTIPLDGKPLPFNAKNVEAALIELPDLLIEIQQQAQSFALFRTNVLEIDSEN